MKIFAFALSFLLTALPSAARAQDPAIDAVAPRACSLPALSLSALLAAYDAHSHTRHLEVQALAQARRARVSAWLPQLMISAEHRKRQDQREDQERVVPLSRQRRHEQGLVFRAQIRWQLNELVHHHASLSALRLAQNLAQQHAKAKSILAQNFTRWQLLFLKHCASQVLSAQERRDCELLRAQILVATGVVLPHLQP